jgi:hypothetical protein
MAGAGVSVEGSGTGAGVTGAEERPQARRQSAYFLQSHITYER